MKKELADYIFNYCYDFFNEKERKANEHQLGQIKFGNRENVPEPIEKLRHRMKYDSEVLSLLKEGYSKFITTTAERIYRDHKQNLKLNLCPKCREIARTPTARQCRFCGHDWHDKI